MTGCARAHYTQNVYGLKSPPAQSVLATAAAPTTTTAAACVSGEREREREREERERWPAQIVTTHSAAAAAVVVAVAAAVTTYTNVASVLRRRLWDLHYSVSVCVCDHCEGQTLAGGAGDGRDFRSVPMLLKGVPWD